MQKLKNRMYKDGSTASFRMKGTHRFQDTIEKVFRFVNRSYEQLLIVLAKLKMRYRTVSISRKLVGTLYTGQMTVTL